MASNKCLLVLISTLMVLAITFAHSSSSKESPKKARESEAYTGRDTSILYHLLEGQRPRPEENKHYFNPPLDEYQTNPREEEEYVSIVPNPKYVPRSRNKQQYQAITLPPYYPQSTPTPKAHCKNCKKCGCNSKKNHKKLLKDFNKHRPGNHYDPGHVTETYHDENSPQTYNGKGDSRKKCSCADRKVLKIKHFLIRKTE